MATLAVTLGLALLLVAGRTPELLRRLDLWIYDAWVRATLVAPAHLKVTVLELDEASLDRLGQWPWPRDRIAQIVRRVLDEGGARVLAMDVVFAEPDRSDAPAIRERLQKVPPSGDAPLRAELEALVKALDRDAALAQTLQGRPVVLGYYFNADPKLRNGALPEPWLPAEIGREMGLAPQAGLGFGANLQALVEAAGRAGHFNPSVDLDGITRRVPMVIEHEGMLYPSLSLAVLTLLAGDKAAIDVGRSDGEAGTTETLNVGPFSLPVDERVRSLVPFFGGRGSMPRLSVAELLEGRFDPALLKDRVVVFGPTAPGLKDNRATPVDRNQPGVELHASLLQGALDGQLPAQPHYTQAAVLSVVGLVGLLMLLGARRLKPLTFLLAAFGAAAGVLGLGFGLWWWYRAVLPVAMPLAQIALLFVVLGALGYVLETRSRNAINRLFGQYVPPELVGEMNQDPGAYGMSARAAELTVMFADVRGFTTLSEKMDPVALGELMNRLLTELSRVIRGVHLGTIDKYIGDCVMAFWGAPVARSDHARAAVAAALDMQTALDALVPTLTLPEGAHIAVGIGLNTGPAVVGNMGSAYRMAYTALGDTVNTASRLEGVTKAYGARIVASDSVREAAGEGFVWRELDRVRVKGRDAPLGIHEPLSRDAEASPGLAQRAQQHAQALAAYRTRDFGRALEIWRALQAQGEDTLTEVWIGRAAWLQDNPPPADWDGVWTFETK